MSALFCLAEIRSNVRPPGEGAGYCSTVALLFWVVVVHQKDVSVLLWVKDYAAHIRYTKRCSARFPTDSRLSSSRAPRRC